MSIDSSVQLRTERHVGLFVFYVGLFLLSVLERVFHTASCLLCLIL
jgi:hypothetical protein